MDTTGHTDGQLHPKMKFFWFAPRSFEYCSDIPPTVGCSSWAMTGGDTTGVACEHGVKGDAAEPLRRSVEQG